jgi:hypothetical protein
MPALKEANVGDVRVLRVALGGNTNAWITFSFVDGWPPKENNMLAKSMGESAMREMLAEGASMQTSGFDYFYRYRSDLSYTAE